MTAGTCDLSDLPAAALTTTTQHYSSPSLYQFLALFVNVLLQIFISFVAVYMSYVCIKLKFKKTAFHAWFCTIGYCCLMAEGMMTYYQGNILTHPFDMYTKNTIHLILSATGGLMGMIGSFQKYYTYKGKRHFATIHGKIGLVSTCVCFFTFTSGIASLYMDEPKVGHAVISTFVFLTGMYAQYTGYNTGFFRRNFDLEMKLLFKFLLVVTVVLSCIAPFKNLLLRLYSKF